MIILIKKQGKSLHFVRTFPHTLTCNYFLYLCNLENRMQLVLYSDYYPYFVEYYTITMKFTQELIFFQETRSKVLDMMRKSSLILFFPWCIKQLYIRSYSLYMTLPSISDYLGFLIRKTLINPNYFEKIVRTSLYVKYAVLLFWMNLYLRIIGIHRL